jgi:HEAT repeat protein
VYASPRPAGRSGLIEAPVAEDYVPIPRAFKTDESFLEKIAIGATGTRQVFADLEHQEHAPLELERGSMSFKIWKAIKIKRIRLPDILCLRCGHRWESRAKTRMTITMSHSLSVQDRGWDFGLRDDDFVALVQCERNGESPLDWVASHVVQYIRVAALRAAWVADRVKIQRPKGAQEGFEIQATWPAAVVPVAGVVEQVTGEIIRYRPAGAARAAMVRLNRAGGRLLPLVAPRDVVQPGQIVAAVVPVSTSCPCPGGADLSTYLKLSVSVALSDRYTAVKALSRFMEPAATEALTSRVQDPQENIYVRVDAAAGLMRREDPLGRAALAEILRDPYLENRLEAAIVLGEVATPAATALLLTNLQDPEQHAEIRAGAAWSLGEIGAETVLPALVESFNAIELVIRIEAARALAKIARRHLDAVLKAFPRSTPPERPGVAWALSKTGGFTVEQLLPTLIDTDARQWVAYILGTQERDAMLGDIESLARQDPEVYFAVTVLWNILASWTYGLEEY